LKVAILGTENSHAWCFSSTLLGKDGSKYFPELDLIGVYGDKNTEDGKLGNEKVAEGSNCPHFADHYNDYLEEAEAILVTARDGKNHLKYAYEYLKKGIPVWLDKPVVGSVEDAEELVKLVKEYGSPICGGSSLAFTDEIVEAAEYVKNHKDEVLGGHIISPIQPDSEYGGFWFYGQHLVQMVTAVFGTDIKRVKAERIGDSVQITYYYDNYVVTAFGGSGFGITVYNNANECNAKSIQLGSDFFMPELKEFYHMTQTGKGVEDLREFLAPVYIIDATVRAYEENKTVEVKLPNF